MKKLVYIYYVYSPLVFSLRFKIEGQWAESVDGSKVTFLGCESQDSQ